MIVEVTAYDIMIGCRNSCKRDPISLAIKRATNYEHQVTVDDNEIWIAFKYRGPTPKIVADFIRDFDAGHRNLKPFSFELEL